MKLGDLVDPALLKQMLTEKFVRAQTHPVFPLTIFNYTDQCMWTGEWNDVTRQCRGLIASQENGDVVARPFDKFFNYGEYAEGKRTDFALDMHSQVQTTDKKDGSLGILYPTLQGWSVATRGSFTSEQAIRASFIWWKKYAEFPVPEDWTLLFEIIYPGNRIVLDYGELDDLVLLGARNIKTGDTIGPDHFLLVPWQGPRTEVFEDRTLEQALRRPPRVNAEGVVVHYVSGPLTGKRVKIKQDDYVLMHRLITGMNARVIWERMGTGEVIEDVQRGVPEEFWSWIAEVGDELQAKASEILTGAYDDFDRIKCALPVGWSRKDFAFEAQQSEHKPYLFMLLDGRDIRQAIWKNIKPSGERSMKYISEDVA